MKETRALATGRLRREGRWDAAWLMKEQKREAYRASGVSRTEANNRAWDEMIAFYPPMSPAEIEWQPVSYCLACAAFQPDLGAVADRPHEADFNTTWKCVWYTFARSLRTNAGDVDGAGDIAFEMVANCPDGYPPSIALVSPVEFMTDLAPAKFRRVLRRIEDEGLPAVLKAELVGLLGILEGIPKETDFSMLGGHVLRLL